MTSPQNPTVQNDYRAALAALTGKGASLADLATLQRTAAAFAATATGPEEIRADAANASALIAGILTEALQATPANTDADQLTPRGYALTAHLISQAKAKGFSLQDLIDTVDAPSTVYESRRYPGQVKHVRGNLCVAVDPASKRAITVFIDQEFTERRADQTDADALAYERKRKAAQKKTTRG